MKVIDEDKMRKPVNIFESGSIFRKHLYLTLGILGENALDGCILLLGELCMDDPYGLINYSLYRCTPLLWVLFGNHYFCSLDHGRDLIPR